MLKWNHFTLTVKGNEVWGHLVKVLKIWGHGCHTDVVLWLVSTLVYHNFAWTPNYQENVNILNIGHLTFNFIGLWRCNQGAMQIAIFKITVLYFDFRYTNPLFDWKCHFHEYEWMALQFLSGLITINTKLYLHDSSTDKILITINW